MMWCAVASNWLVAARTATVLPMPTSPVMTPSSDSLMQKRMSATASWWLARSHNWAAGMVLLNGVRVKPKWLTHGARLIAGPPKPQKANLDTQYGRATALRARRRPCSGNRRRSMAVALVAGLAAPVGAHGDQ